jgi:EmrB/QacA subfamily drug resistance transporter
MKQENSSATSASSSMLLWLVAIAFFMQTLDATIVNTALPAMAHSLGESPLRMQSVVIAYTLTMAMLIPASGWIADKFGTRQVFLCAIVLFSAGSLLCAWSTSLGYLVASRVIQGIGGAMLLPVGRLAVLRAFPQKEFLRAMSFVTVPGMIGPLVGPLLGGWLVEYVSWHWVFLINIPIGVAGCVATVLFMPDFRRTAPGRFDLPGYLLLAAGMVMLSLGIEGLSDPRLGLWISFALLVAGPACVLVYWRRTRNQATPLFPPALFKVDAFRIGLLGNLFTRIGVGGMPYLIPLVLQIRLGYSAFEAGMMMVPAAVAGIVIKRLATELIRTAGYRIVLIANTLLIGVTIASFAFFLPGQPLWLRIIQLVVFGAANSLQFTAMNSVSLKDLDASLASGGNSMQSTLLMLSMSLGVAVAGLLLSAFTALLPAGTAGAGWTFPATFLSLGIVTAASAWIFRSLPHETLSRPRSGESDGKEAA